MGIGWNQGNKKSRPKPGYASHLARIYDSRN
nr:MAG TPA: hypothetical protein [Caudoviricetes sp.]